jgi:hypothetical protein
VQFKSNNDDFFFLQSRKKTHPLSRRALKMNMDSFFRFCSAHFDVSREIISLKFRTSDGTECTAYRNGTDGQWQHMLDFFDRDDPSWIEVFIGDDENDEIDLKTWYELLNPSEISEVNIIQTPSFLLSWSTTNLLKEFKGLAVELRRCYENPDKDVGRVLKKIEILVEVGRECML